MIERRQCDVDLETGQVFNAKKYKYNNFDNDKGYLFRAKNQATRTFNDIRLSDYVKDRYDFMRCHLLAEYIYKDTNMISYRTSARNIRPADIEDISKITGLSYKKTREFLSKMRKLHIIAEREDKVGDLISIKYYFNPLFFSSKKYLQPDLYFLFHESIDCYIPGWAKARYSEIGNIKNE